MPAAPRTSRHGRRPDHAAGDRRPGALACALRLGFVAVHRADARRIPVATTAVGNSGATNAGLLAVQILSTTDKRLADALQEYRDALKEKVAESNAQLV